MPFPKLMARSNRWLVNPLMRRFAGTIPPFALIEHVGRRTGKRYRTPVFAFSANDGFVIALVYTRDSDWVHNVLARDGCTITYRRRRFALAEPRLTDGAGADAANALPRVVQLALRVIRVTEYLFLRRDDAQRASIDQASVAT